MTLPSTPFPKQASFAAPATGPRDNGSVVRGPGRGPGVERFTRGPACSRDFGKDQRHRFLRLVRLAFDVSSILYYYNSVSN